MMDWYSLVKLLHVTAALLWVGGGFALTVLAVRSDMAGDVDGTLGAMKAVGVLGNRLFMPASLVTLLFGLVMCWFWVGFSELWVIIGLAGYMATFLVGSLIFKPTADRMGEIIARDGVTPAVLVEGRRILKVARFDYTVMLIVVADMVLKPASGDFGILAVMAVMLVAGTFAAFGPSRQTEPVGA